MEKAFGTALGARVDTVESPPSVRRRLLSEFGIIDRASHKSTRAPNDQPISERVVTTGPALSFQAVLHMVVSRLSHSYYFLPAIGVTWFMVEVVPRGIPTGNRELIGGIILVMYLTFYAAAAAKCANRWPEGLFRLWLQRFSACMSYVWFLVMLMIAITVVYALMRVGAGLDDRAARDATEVIGWVVTGALLARLWPLWPAPFLYGGHSHWSLAAGANVWVGPGLAVAWQMTKARGVFWSLTLPLGMLAAILLWIHRPLSSSWVGQLWFYAISLPVLALFSDAAAEQIRLDEPEVQ